MMSQRRISRRKLSVGALAAAITGVAGEAWAIDEHAVDQASDEALAELYAANPQARELGQRARAILIFPHVVKAGVMIGGLRGDGVLRVQGRATGYYRITAASYGLQAGAQSFSYALFFITQASLDYLDRSHGWSIGSGPSVVVVDDGFARTLNSTTLTQDVYAMIFGQRGLMAGVGLEGANIARVED